MGKKLIESTQKKITRPFCIPPLLDFDQNVKDNDKRVLMARSRSAYYNNPLIRSIIQQRAMFSTKNGWAYQSLVEDKEWRVLAEAYFEKWSRVATVSGLDFKHLIYQICISIDRDGDAFIMLTESIDGFPQVQWIPSHRVQSRNDENIVLKGKHKGKKIVSGIIVNSFNRPVAYSVLGDTEADDRIVDAVNMVHIFDPESAEAVRGIALISHTIQALDDLEASKDAELMAQRMYSSTALIEHLDAADDNQQFLANNCGMSGMASLDTPLYEEFKEGQITVYRSQGSDLKALETQRPSLQWQSFRKDIIQQIVCSLNWSTSMLDGSDKTSVENRVNLRVCEITIADRIALLAPHIQRITFYVLSKAINRGDLPPTEEYWRMSFTRPPFISAEISKIEASTRENLRFGITNLSQIVSEQGRTLEEHLREKYEDMAIDQLIRAEVEAKYGVDLSNTIEQTQNK